MCKFLVAGIVQMETIVKVNKIPVTYTPVTSEPQTIFTYAGGDAYNESLALTWLGNKVEFLSMVGKQQNMDILNPSEKGITLDTRYIVPSLEATPTAVVLYGTDGTQQIFEDIKNIRDTTYDAALFEERVKANDMILVSNCNFCRPLIALAKKHNKPLAVNIRRMREETLKYNKDYLEAADILYLSDDELTEEPYEYMKNLAKTYDPQIIVLGQGSKGVILYEKKAGTYINYPTVKTNEIVNKVGAGNALFSCFLHYYFKTGDAKAAIKNAQLFASYKIGYMGTSYGFMTEAEIEQWKKLIWHGRDY